MPTLPLRISIQLIKMVLLLILTKLPFCWLGAVQIGFPLASHKETPAAERCWAYISSLGALPLRKSSQTTKQPPSLSGTIRGPICAYSAVHKGIPAASQSLTPAAETFWAKRSAFWVSKRWSSQIMIAPLSEVFTMRGFNCGLAKLSCSL